MTELTEKRAIAFISTIAGRCTSCLRRTKENCRNCISSWANEIMKAYEDDARAANTKDIDYSMSARMLMIASTLDRAQHPLLPHVIDLREYCTPQLKRWTLLKMMKLGIVGRRRLKRKGPHNTLYEYYLKDIARLKSATESMI